MESNFNSERGDHEQIVEQEKASPKSIDQLQEAEEAKVDVDKALRKEFEISREFSLKQRHPESVVEPNHYEILKNAYK